MNYVQIYFSVLFFLLICERGNSLKCQEQRCRECNERELNGMTREVTCNLENLITTDWLGSPPPLPSPPNVRPEYACLKMTASNPAVLGDSTDIIKGCTVYIGADYQCQILGGIEVSRGKKNAKCDYCHSDNCNGSSPIFIHFPYVLVSLLLICLNK